MLGSLREKALFLKHFLARPKQVGSVLPSSSYLTESMAREVYWDEARTVVELGAGTGVLSRRIREHARDARVFLFETQPELARKLHEEFPDYICCPSAENLNDSLAVNGAAEVDCILSGLPFFNFSPAVRMGLICQIDEALKPEGNSLRFNIPFR